MNRAVRRSSAYWITALLGAASLVAASVTAAAGSTGWLPSHKAPSARAAAVSALGTPSDTGATDITNLGGGGWKVQSSATATQTGAQISTPGFNTSTWLPVANDDAGAPGTEIEALAQNGLCPGDTALQPVNQSNSGPSSVFFSNNMQLCYGFTSRIGPVTVNAFAVPWLWRTDFTPNLVAGQVASLTV